MSSISTKHLSGKIQITEAEKKIIQDYADGLNGNEISTKRNISKKTLDTHMYNLKRRTGLKTIGHVVATFFREKVIK